ncbi:hypothetical protein [Glycomyces paridis]|uniref:DUF4097 domain-containing protein n=1 Tax=Glycomyces paridis TaxID=2126555 RepID=A0A4S8NX33_9ACTN|nr:hypothetical protein [Glycomyces paridis]THV20842.1 hypothetical protein E9998_24955 [Glycomyces paridis]
MTTFTTPGPITATVQVAGARVHLNATDRADTVVTVAPVDPTSRTDLKVAEKTKVAFTAGRLSVKTTASGAKQGSVDITIDLPADSALVAYLANSSIHAAGPLGDCELHTATSRITLARVAALQADLGAGALIVDRIDGEARINGGKVAVRIGHAAADLEFSCAGGRLDIDRADASVTAQAGDAPIRIGRLTNGHAKLWNGAGNIELGIDPASSADIRTDSKKGSVTNSAAASSVATKSS